MINIFSIGILTANAASLLNEPTNSANTMELNAGSACMKDGSCQLNDFTLVAINVSKIILSIVGSLSLIAFVVGGLMMMLSAGNPEWVTRGKQTIIGAVIGLVIVFTSYTIIYFVYGSLGINFTGKSEFPTQQEKKLTPTVTVPTSGDAAGSGCDWGYDAATNTCLPQPTE